MAGRHGRIELIAGTLVALLGGAALPSSAQAPASFALPVSFQTGALPITVGIADVNGDGKPDLVTVNTGANTVSVLPGNGAGSFGSRTDFATGAVPHGLAIADLDGDGNPDLVVANTGANTVSVLLGTGTGTFAPAMDFPTGAAPFFVAVGDLNRDGIPDLVVVNVNAPDTVSVLLGIGDGTFGPKADFATGAGPRSVAIGDLDGDGNLDLVVANVTASTVSVLLGTGTGSFGPKTDFPTGTGARDVAIADVNGDGKLDVVVANAGAGSVSVLLGAGDGTLGTKTDFLVGAGPRSVAIGDVNEDGILDLVVANSDSNTVSVLLGTGTGSFAAKTDLATGAGTRPFSVAIGDLNGNGQRDLAVANVSANTVSVFLNTIAPVIAVTPSSQGFGNVPVGSTADRTFTVTNAGGGMLTGSASTSAPSFSIVGEGFYNLPAGTSKTVTARFQPTAVAIVTGNVKFTYSGGSVSRGLMGTGTNSVPVPVLGALSPSSATAGGAAFTLTVSGTNFVVSSRVRWNGSNRTTTFVSATELRAAIPASDVALAGSAQITVFDFLPIGERSNTLTFTINQSVPVLAALSPSSATAGGAGFTLTVSGANFVAPSVVRWNGLDRTTTFVSSTELRAAISSSDITTAGTTQITVFNPLPGGGTSGALTFTITNQMFTLTVTVRGSGVGSVVSTPAGINCSSVCSGTFTVNAVTLTGAPAADASFKSWNGSCGGASPSCTVALGPTAVTATFSAVFTDATLTAQGTAIKAVHITELRSAIDTLRTRNGLSAFAYTDATLTPGTTVVRGIHLTELGTALREMGPFTDPAIVVGQTVIKATHLNELRKAVRDLE